MQVRVYQLAGDAMLKAASYEEILEDDAKALGNSLLRVEQVTLFPDSAHQVVIAPKDDVQSIAVVALFRQPQGRDWYAVYDVENPPEQQPCPADSPTLSVQLDRMQLKDGPAPTDSTQPAETLTEPEQRGGLIDVE